MHDESPISVPSSYVWFLESTEETKKKSQGYVWFLENLRKNEKEKNEGKLKTHYFYMLLQTHFACFASHKFPTNVSYI